MKILIYASFSFTQIFELQNFWRVRLQSHEPSVFFRYSCSIVADFYERSSVVDLRLETKIGD